MSHAPSRFARALALAHDLHGAQTRKGGSVPYVSHLLAVAALVMKMGGDEDQAIAALLHDAIEDQGERIAHADIVAAFGPRVAAIVQACTDETAEERRSVPWVTRKLRYLAHIPHLGDDVMLVMAADKLDNARDIVREHALIGDALWARFTGRREGMLWYLGRLAAEMETWLAGPRGAGAKCAPLIREFAALTRALPAVPDPGIDIP